MPDLLSARLARPRAHALSGVRREKAGFRDARPVPALLPSIAAPGANVHQVRSDTTHLVPRQRRHLSLMPETGNGSTGGYTGQRTNPEGTTRTAPAFAAGLPPPTLGKRLPG